jgi:hypothetical protein
VLSARDPDTYEAAVAALLDHQRAAECDFVAVPDPGDQVDWPWLASTSAR